MHERVRILQARHLVHVFMKNAMKNIMNFMKNFINNKNNMPKLRKDAGDKVPKQVEDARREAGPLNLASCISQLLKASGILQLLQCVLTCLGMSKRHPGVKECQTHRRSTLDREEAGAFVSVLLPQRFQTRRGAHNSTTTVGPPGAGASKPCPGPAILTRSSLNTCSPGASSLTARSIPSQLPHTVGLSSQAMPVVCSTAHTDLTRHMGSSRP
jgi:hypothetical protein